MSNRKTYSISRQHRRRGGPMEEKYWKEFMKTGGVCDYLGYKMELYGHMQGEHGKDDTEVGKGESDHSNRDGASDGACRRI